MVWVYVLISVFLVSLVSLIGVFSLALKDKILQKILIYFVAFSSGALIGDVFLHLLPEATNKDGFSVSVSMLLFLGVVSFFILEKVLRWRHCHEVGCENHSKHIGTLSLVSDAVHNFIDGVLIGVSFLVSIPLGITTTLAVLLHEIPQELGNFAVLLHSGFTKEKALWFNFITALTAILGAILAIALGNRLGGLEAIMVPFTAGSFLYIAMTDLIPELHKEAGWKASLIQLLFIVGGFAMMGLLLLLEA